MMKTSTIWLPVDIKQPKSKSGSFSKKVKDIKVTWVNTSVMKMILIEMGMSTRLSIISKP
jgi:hypothetical protein